MGIIIQRPRPGPECGGIAGKLSLSLYQKKSKSKAEGKWIQKVNSIRYPWLITEPALTFLICCSILFPLIHHGKVNT